MVTAEQKLTEDDALAAAEELQKQLAQEIFDLGAGKSDEVPDFPSLGKRCNQLKKALANNPRGRVVVNTLLIQIEWLVQHERSKLCPCAQARPRGIMRPVQD